LNDSKYINKLHFLKKLTESTILLSIHVSVFSQMSIPKYIPKQRATTFCFQNEVPTSEFMWNENNDDWHYISEYEYKILY